MRRVLEIIAVVVSALSFIVIVALHFGLADRVLNLGPANTLANRFDISYGSNGPYMVHPGDPAFTPTLWLIERYSKNRPDPQKVRTIARWVAIAAFKPAKPLPGDVDAEWTVPTTPIVVAYGYPDIRPVDKHDAVFVGDIQDLHDWIQRARDDFHFWTTDVIIALLALSVGTAMLFARPD